MSALLRLPLELREQIFEDVIFTPAYAPPLDIPFLKRLHESTLPESSSQRRFYVRLNETRLDNFQQTIKAPRPASELLRLCCRQMQFEVQNLLSRLSKSRTLVYKLDLKFHDSYDLPQLTWTSIPVPLQYVRRVEVDILSTGVGFRIGCGGVTRDFYILIFLLATFLRSGPSFSNTSSKSPIPFLEEVAVNYKPQCHPGECTCYMKACAKRSPADAHGEFVSVIADFIGSGVMHGLLRGMRFVGEDLGPRHDYVEGRNYYDMSIARRMVKDWSDYHLPDDWITTQRAAYARNRADNQRLGVEKYPTSDVWDKEEPDQPET